MIKICYNICSIFCYSICFYLIKTHIKPSSSTCPLLGRDFTSLLWDLQAACIINIDLPARSRPLLSAGQIQACMIQIQIQIQKQLQIQIQACIINIDLPARSRPPLCWTNTRTNTNRNTMLEKHKYWYKYKRYLSALDSPLC